jgi:hypothetical protein
VYGPCFCRRQQDSVETDDPSSSSSPELLRVPSRKRSAEIHIGGNDEDDEAYSEWLHMRKLELEERRRLLR